MVVIVQISQVEHAVADVMEPHGITIQVMAVHLLMLWAEQINIKVILAKADWYRSHGAKYN
jgi:hypothetical protein